MRSRVGVKDRRQRLGVVYSIGAYIYKQPMCVSHYHMREYSIHVVSHKMYA